MPNYNLDKYGTVEINKKKIKCNINISADEFFERFKILGNMLSDRAKSTVKSAINSGREEKTKDQDELESYFARVQEEAKKGEPTKTYESKDTNSKTSQGKRVGSSEEEVEGERIAINVQEKIIAKYEYNFLSDEKESTDETGEEETEDGEEEKKSKEPSEGYGILTRDGQIIFKNIASDQRIWDITGQFKHNGAIENLDEEFSIQELNGEEEYPIEYKIKADKEPSLKLKENISTINDPNTITYSLNMDQDNEVYFNLELTNTEEYPIENIVVKKELFDGASNVDIKSVSIGEHRTEDNHLIWEIEKLESNAHASLEFTLTVHIADKEEKVRSGMVEIEYDAATSLSELTVENFEATGENMVSTTEEQIEDRPDIFIGFLEYENLSPYIAKLKKVSVKEMEKDNAPELIELSEDSEIFLSAGGIWQSNTWEIDTKGEIPKYQKTAQFILLHDLKAITSTTVQIEDIELAVAIFNAEVSYDIETIESYREVPFTATHSLTNGGATPFDYLSIEQTVPEHFKMPEKEEIKLTVDGKEYDLDPDWIKIEDRRLFIEMDGLKDTEMGMFEPNQELQVIFPIIADQLSPEESFVSPITWKANTLPRGEPIVITEEGEEVKIEVIHRRLKIFRGKSVLATGTENVYEIVLKVRNRGEFAVENYELRDRVPAKFDVKDPSIEPTETEKLDGREVLIWMIEEIPADGEVEVRYTIEPTDEEATASEAQFSM
ncbi:MAG: hypothetical protein K9W44_08970 [Candidatus Lokiarchaeota archaeon]|nr:hypothetical protein [Candidatus Harpocratesius repetitus]